MDYYGLAIIIGGEIINVSSNKGIVVLFSPSCLLLPSQVFPDECVDIYLSSMVEIGDHSGLFPTGLNIWVSPLVSKFY